MNTKLLILSSAVSLEISFMVPLYSHIFKQIWEDTERKNQTKTCKHQEKIKINVYLLSVMSEKGKLTMIVHDKINSIKIFQIPK